MRTSKLPTSSFRSSTHCSTYTGVCELPAMYYRKRCFCLPHSWALDSRATLDVSFEACTETVSSDLTRDIGGSASIVKLLYRGTCSFTSHTLPCVLRASICSHWQLGNDARPTFPNPHNSQGCPDLDTVTTADAESFRTLHAIQCGRIILQATSSDFVNLDARVSRPSTRIGLSIARCFYCLFFSTPSKGSYPKNTSDRTAERKGSPPTRTWSSR